MKRCKRNKGLNAFTKQKHKPSNESASLSEAFSKVTADKVFRIGEDDLKELVSDVISKVLVEQLKEEYECQKNTPT